MVHIATDHLCGFLNLPFDGGKLLGVPHDLAKVDVEHVASVFEHDVVVVAITDAQHERGHTPAGTGVQEVHDSLRKRSLHCHWFYLQFLFTFDLYYYITFVPMFDF